MKVGIDRGSSGRLKVGIGRESLGSSGRLKVGMLRFSRGSSGRLKVGIDGPLDLASLGSSPGKLIVGITILGPGALDTDIDGVDICGTLGVVTSPITGGGGGRICAPYLVLFRRTGASSGGV